MKDRTIPCTPAADGAFLQWCVNSRREVMRSVLSYLRTCRYETTHFILVARLVSTSNEQHVWPRFRLCIA